MEQVNKYVNSVYRHVGGDEEEIKILKEEMKSHLLQMIEELKSEGKSEEESISIAIKRFGEETQIESELIGIFKFVNTKAKKALIAALSFLLIAIISFSILIIGTNVSIKKYTANNTEIFNTMKSYDQESIDTINKHIEKVLNKSKKSVKYVAIFRVTNGEDEWYRNLKGLEYVYPRDIQFKDIDKSTNIIEQIIAKNGMKYNVNVGLYDNASTPKYIKIVGKSTFVWLGCCFISIIAWILIKTYSRMILADNL
ncbi:permease prefix domain 1-containing protein [Clostridium sp. JNZ J1-5]